LTALQTFGPEKIVYASDPSDAANLDDGVNGLNEVQKLAKLALLSKYQT